MDTILEELSPVRKRGQCAPAFTMHQRRRSLDRLTSPEDRHTAVISRVLAPSGARLLSWASDGHRPKAQLEGPQTLLIAGFGWDEKNSVCYLAISQATVRGILSMEVIPARHRGNAHLHLPRHWFADPLKFGPILSEPVCFLSSLHPDKPHGARCRDSQIHHSCTQAEGGGGGLGRAGVEELSPVRKRGQCAPAFTMHQRRRSLDRLTRPEDRHTAVISRVLAPSGALLLSWASDGHRPKAQLEGPQTLLIAGFGWDEKNSVCYLAISQATVRGILSMEVIPARHWGDAHLHLPRHWFADTLKFGPILSEPVCFLSSLHPDKPHGARCRDSQIHHSCTQAEGGGGGGWAEREK